jgi:hypothetical protein
MNATVCHGNAMYFSLTVSSSLILFIFQGGGLGPEDDLESLIRHHEKGQSKS